MTLCATCHVLDVPHVTIDTTSPCVTFWFRHVSTSEPLNLATRVSHSRQRWVKPTRRLPGFSRSREHHQRTLNLIIIPFMPLYLTFGLGVKHTLHSLASWTCSSCSSPKFKLKKKFQILIFNRNIRKRFSPSLLFQIKHMTYRWKALGRLYLMVRRSQRNKKNDNEFWTL